MQLVPGCSSNQLPPKHRIKPMRSTHLSCYTDWNPSEWVYIKGGPIEIDIRRGYPKYYLTYLYIHQKIANILNTKKHVVFWLRVLDIIVFASLIYFFPLGPQSPSGKSFDRQDVYWFNVTQLEHTVAKSTANALGRAESTQCTIILR